MTALLPFLLGAIAWAVLLFAGRGVAGAAWFSGAFVALGLAGYAWQGRPGLPAAPASGQPAAVRDSLFADERPIWFERFGGDAQTLDMADALIRQGAPDYAAGVLRGELSRRPRSATLWTGYGNALVAQAGGMVTPVARFAFGRAAALAPDQPAADYFLALAEAQAGQIDGAEARWRAIAARPDLRPAWRAAVEAKLAAAARFRAMQPTP